MSSVIISGDTSGAITLSAPAVSGTNTITLPAATGTVVLTGTTPTLNGITFPATQVSSADANTLDDYEEGTFTPIIFGLTSAGTTTYSDQVGYYTKVGNLVTLFYQVTVTAMTGTGALALGGFPFTTSANGAGCSPVMIDGLNWGGGSYVQLYVGQSRTNAIPYLMTDDNSWNAQQVVNEAQAYIATITYRV